MAWSTEGSLGSLAVQIPLLGRQIALRHVSTPGATPPAAPPKGEPVPVRCNPKEVWRQWMSGFLKPATDWRIAPRELMLDVSLKCASRTFAARALVDTGARIPLVFRHSLLPPGLLQPARFPVQFSTATGAPMSGGTSGLMLQLVLPIEANEEVFLVKTTPLFAYETDIAGCDIIIGYPFLKAYHLLPDPVRDRLTFWSSSGARGAATFGCVPPDEEVVHSSPDECRPVFGPDGPPRIDHPLVVFLVERQFPSPPGVLCDAHPVVDESSDLVPAPCVADSIPPPGESCEAARPTDDAVSEDTSVGCSDSDLSDFDVSETPDWSSFRPDLTQLRAVASEAFSANPKAARAAMRTGAFRIHPLLYRELVDASGFEPQVDAFASPSNHVCGDFYTQNDLAFAHSWAEDSLWICPPFNRLPAVVEKICADEAHGIMLVPVWQRKPWFQALGKVAVTWWDLPKDAPALLTHEGTPISARPSTRLRAVYFNAFGFRSRNSPGFKGSAPTASACVDEASPLRSIIPELPLYQELRHSCRAATAPALRSISALPEKLHRLMDAEWDGLTDDDFSTLRSVIASAKQHPDASSLVDEIQQLFHSELHEPKLARDVDPLVRGPHGVAHIELHDGAVPCAKKPFRTLGEREAALQGIIDKYLARGWIVPSKSEWASQAFVVPKPTKADGSKDWRLVIDYRYLNSQTKGDPFPLPLIENLIGLQADNRIWSILDLEDGFHQMHLAPESQPYTAFVTPWGTFQFTVLPMGIKNGPALFQRMIMWVLRSVPAACVYIDDVLVGSRGDSPAALLRNHFLDLSDVLHAFRRHKITAKGSKVYLYMLMVKFCGHILFDGQRRAAPSKLEALEKWSRNMIKTITHLRGFLGLAQYYSAYVRDFAALAHPLSEQLKARKKSDRRVVWNDDMRASFEALKRALLDNVVLSIADPNKSFVLEVDASDYAVGGVLSQEDAEGRLRPVSFFSRKLQGSPGKGQVGWHVREKETYAIVLCLKKFRSWLASTTVFIRVLTDHQSLQHWFTEDLNKQVAAVGRRGRWHEFLSTFNLEVVYVPGKDHQVSDALSRWAYPAGLEVADASFHGGPSADAHARRCDGLEDLYDGFPSELAASVAPIRARTLAPRPRAPPSAVPIFQRKWDYTTDPVFGPIVTSLASGSSPDYRSLENLRVH